ncbi:MAG: hypothetical protein ABJP48_09655 [Erythrobacter sp.]
MRCQYLLAGASLATLFAACSAQAQSSTEAYTYDALGRLIKVETSGGQNDDETRAICYDDAGNRTDYEAVTGSTTLSCSAGSAPPPPPPPPPPSPPPPPPSNNPPQTGADGVSGACSTGVTVNLTANDTDPEANYPLVLIDITRTNGTASASISSQSSVSVDFAATTDFAEFTYTVADSLGATATGQLTVSTTCGDGPNF